MKEVKIINISLELNSSYCLDIIANQRNYSLQNSEDVIRIHLIHFYFNSNQISIILLMKTYTNRNSIGIEAANNIADGIQKCPQILSLNLNLS